MLLLVLLLIGSSTIKSLRESWLSFFHERVIYLDLPDCDKCNNERRVKTEDGFKFCDCVAQASLKDYLCSVGKMSLPESSFLDKLDEQLSDVNDSDNLYINIPSSFSVRQFNGTIGYLLKKLWYPEDYRMKNLYHTYISMRDEGSFSDIFKFSGDLLILTSGVGVEYEADWLDDNLAKCGQQIVNNRLSNGLITWFAAQNGTHSPIEETMNKNDFISISASSSYSSSSSGNSVEAI